MAWYIRGGAIGVAIWEVEILEHPGGTPFKAKMVTEFGMETHHIIRDNFYKIRLGKLLFEEAPGITYTKPGVLHIGKEWIALTPEAAIKRFEEAKAEALKATQDRMVVVENAIKEFDAYAAGARVSLENLKMELQKKTNLDWSPEK